MSIVDDLVANLVERNAINLRGTLVISLHGGGIGVRGTLVSALRDQKRNVNLLNATIPVNADVKIGDIIIPVPGS